MTNQDEFIDSHEVEAQSLPAVLSAKELDDFQSPAEVTNNPADSAFVYLQKIARVPLLSQQQEIELFQQFEKAAQRITELFDQLPPPILQSVQLRFKQRRNRKPETKQVSDSGQGGRWWSSMQIAAILDQIDQEIKGYQGIEIGGSQSLRCLDSLWLALNDATRKMRQLKKEIVEANLLLVASIAKRYLFNGNPLSFLDLMQEGSIGLMKAVNKFDLQKGCSR